MWPQVAFSEFSPGNLKSCVFSLFLFLAVASCIFLSTFFSLPFSLLQRTGFYFPHWLSLSLSHSVTFPFTVPFLQTVNWLSKKFFLWTFLTTREKGKMQINPNLCFICRKWWSTSKSQTDVCSAMCWSMNDNLVGQQTTGNVQLQLWHRWQRGLQLESDFFEKNTEYLTLEKWKYHTSDW